MGVNNSVTVQSVGMTHKSKFAYILLALFLGYFGIHKFYANKVATGLFYVVLLMLSWMIVPAILLMISIFVDIAVALTMGDDEFDEYASSPPKRVVATTVNTNISKDAYIDEIERLNELKDRGIITDKEFEAKKKLILFANNKEI